MNNSIIIAENEDTNDLFNNFEIPAFDAGSQNETQTEVQSTLPINNDEASTISSDDITLYISIFIAAIFFIFLLKQIFKIFSKISRSKDIEIIEDEKEPEVPVIPKKEKKEKTRFSTPANINKCIRLFLENTRIK